jgi:heme exporter protein CcmD
MGGYGPYIWTAYGVAALVLGGLTVITWAGYRRSRQALDRLEAQGKGRGRR